MSTSRVKYLIDQCDTLSSRMDIIDERLEDGKLTDRTDEEIANMWNRCYQIFQVADATFLEIAIV